MLDTPAVRNPTIIRTKQSKAPLRPPLPVISQNSSESLWAVPSSSCTQPSESIFDFPDDFSPPMPSVPPPPPPAEVLQVLCSGPPVPPRPSFEFVSTISRKLIFWHHDYQCIFMCLFCNRPSDSVPVVQKCSLCKPCFGLKHIKTISTTRLAVKVLMGLELLNSLVSSHHQTKLFIGFY